MQLIRNVDNQNLNIVYYWKSDVKKLSIKIKKRDLFLRWKFSTFICLPSIFFITNSHMYIKHCLILIVYLEPSVYEFSILEVK